MKTNGYSLVLSPERKQVLLDCIESEENFAEPVPEFTYSRGMPLLCIIVSTNEGITHLGIGRRGIRAGTNMSRLNLDSLMPLERSISIEAMINNIPERFKAVSTSSIVLWRHIYPKIF